jgi:hypothetical protein
VAAVHNPVAEVAVWWLPPVQARTCQLFSLPVGSEKGWVSLPLAGLCVIHGQNASLHPDTSPQKNWERWHHTGVCTTVDDYIGSHSQLCTSPQLLQGYSGCPAVLDDVLYVLCLWPIRGAIQSFISGALPLFGWIECGSSGSLCVLTAVCGRFLIQRNAGDPSYRCFIILHRTLQWQTTQVCECIKIKL